MNASSKIVHTINVKTDALLTFSKIAISTVEQLTALNLSTTRRLLEDGSAVAALMLESNDSMRSTNADKALPLVATESAATYLRSVQAITLEANEAISQLITANFESKESGSIQDAGWLKVFDALSDFARHHSVFKAVNLHAGQHEGHESHRLNRTVP